MKRISRRAFITAAALLFPGTIAADATAIEPKWIVVKRLKIGQRSSPRRVAQISDIHHKGNRARLERMVRLVNGLKPDCVCFTGDLVV
jgi:predicted MPP superfamily phosphohydrolase